MEKYNDNISYIKENNTIREITKLPSIQPSNKAEEKCSFQGYDIEMV